jgi:hypothetical protein
MKLSMGQAAKEAGVSKTSISRAINSGRLSAEKIDGVGYQIDPSELFRVFPRNSNDTSKLERPVTTSVAGDVTPSNALELMRLETENAALKREIDLLRERIDDLRKERDDWKDQAAVVKVITDMRSKISFWSIFKR